MQREFSDGAIIELVHHNLNVLQMAFMYIATSAGHIDFSYFILYVMAKFIYNINIS